MREGEYWGDPDGFPLLALPLRLTRGGVRSMGTSPAFWTTGVRALPTIRLLLCSGPQDSRSFLHHTHPMSRSFKQTYALQIKDVPRTTAPQLEVSPLHRKNFGLSLCVYNVVVKFQSIRRRSTTYLSLRANSHNPRGDPRGGAYTGARCVSDLYIASPLQGNDKVPTLPTRALQLHLEFSKPIFYCNFLSWAF